MSHHLTVHKYQALKISLSILSMKAIKFPKHEYSHHDFFSFYTSFLLFYRKPNKKKEKENERV